MEVVPAAAVAPSTAGHSLPSTAGNLGRTPDDFASAFPFPADMKRAATQSPCVPFMALFLRFSF